MRKTKHKILSGAMALAMAANVLFWAPVQAYAEEPAAVVTSTEETQAEETPSPETTDAPEAGETPAPAEEAPAETATPAPEVTEAPKTTAVPEATAEPATTPEATVEPTATPTAEPEATEVPAETAQPTAGDAILTVTDWEWVTDDENIAENSTLDLSADSAAADDGIATYSAVNRPDDGDDRFTFDAIVTQLPTQIAVQKNDGKTVTLNVKNWASDEYKQNDDGSWPQYGNYLFTAELEDSAQLDANAKKLQIQVFLGDEPTPVPDGLDIGDNTDNGLPNYGVRIVVDPHYGEYYADTNVQLVFRIKYSDPNERALLEWYRYNESTKRYERKYKYTYWINDALPLPYEFRSFSDYSTSYGDHPPYAFVFNKPTTDWQYVCFNMPNCPEHNNYFFMSPSDVLVLRSAKGGTNDTVPGAAGGTIQYEISGYLDSWQSGYVITFSNEGHSILDYKHFTSSFDLSADTDSQKDPHSDILESTYVKIPENLSVYKNSTGIRTLPTSKAGEVNTIRIMQRAMSDDELSEDVYYNGFNIQRGRSYLKDADLEFPTTLTPADLSNLVVIRSDGIASQNDWTIANAAHLQVVLGTPDRPVNRAWGSQFAYRAVIYNYDESSGLYTLCRPPLWGTQSPYSYFEYGHFYYYAADKDNSKAIASICSGGPLNTTWGIHPGGEDDFLAYLQPGQAIVIFPTQTKYEFDYKVQIADERVKDGNVFVLDSVTGGNNGSTWNEGRRCYQSGLISSYGVSDSSTGEQVVLHISKRNSDATQGITFNKLTDGLRTLKVNLFDYTVPDNWHNPTNSVNSAQSDAQLRFVSDSDSNVNDPYINHIYQNDRRMPSTGIVADKLSSITDGNGNTLYNLLPNFKFTTPFSVNLFDLKATIKTQIAPESGLSLAALSSGDSAQTSTNRYKFTYPGVNFQFKYDDNTGTYSYDSHTNHAQYDRTTNTVYQYDHALGMGGTYNHGDWTDKENYVTDSWGTQAAGFFPFDTYVNINADGTVEGTGTNEDGKTTYGTRNPGFDADNNAYGYYYKPAVSNDGTTLLRAEMELDYHFGMSMEHQFTVPYDGKVKGNDMLFSFSGDDDMWLFVDGQLVLDLGGIHEAATGTINFTKGTYSINGVEKPLAEVLTDYAPDTYAKTGAWAGGTDHSFQMFYLERGGTLSNLSISFNLPDEVVQATKVWNDNDQPEKRQDVTLYLEQTTNGTDWTKVAGSEQTIGKTATGDALTVEWLMPMYDETGTKLTYRVREAAGEGCTSEVFIKNGDTWVSEKDAGYADALAAGHEFQIVNTIPKPTATPTPTPEPDENPEPSETPQPGEPTATPTPTAAPTATPKPAEPTAIPTTAKPSNNTPNSNNSSNGSTATATPTEAPKAAVTIARIPQTSDNFPLVGAIIGMMVGAAGVAYVGKKKRK